MQYRNLSDYAASPINNTLTSYQYVLARRYGKTPGEIKGKNQDWFDEIHKQHAGTKKEFYSMLATQDQQRYLVTNGFDPGEVSRLKAFKAMEIITIFILMEEDDWDFVDAYPAWKSKSKSNGNNYQQAWESAARRRCEAFNAQSRPTTHAIAQLNDEEEEESVIQRIAREVVANAETRKVESERKRAATHGTNIADVGSALLKVVAENCNATGSDKLTECSIR